MRNEQHINTLILAWGSNVCQAKLQLSEYFVL